MVEGVAVELLIVLDEFVLSFLASCAMPLVIKIRPTNTKKKAKTNIGFNFFLIILILT